MQRKLIRQGLGGITVHLPKKWVEAHGLDKGDEVDIEESEGKLIIAPKIPKLKRETSIKLVGMEESLIRILIGNTYRLGYDRILVDFENEDQYALLHEIIQNRMIGFEIVKKEQGHCVVENVTEPAADQFENIMQKLFLNIDALFEEAILRGATEKDGKGEDVEELEDRIIRYDHFCRRILLKQRFDPRASLHLAFLMMVVHGQREIYYLLKAVKKGTKYSSDTRKLLEGALALNKQIQESYLKKNPQILAEINKKGRDLIYKQGYSLLEKKQGVDSILVYHLLACIRDFYQAVSPLAGLLL